MYVTLLYVSKTADVGEVHWVHWLQAWATLHRWEEELVPVKNEMHWVTNYFTFWQQQWISWKLVTPDLQGGHLAYAEQQSAMWLEMAQQTHQLFSTTWADFTKDISVFT